jgi:hypothetical protein
MGTITICLDDLTEKRFREVARNILGEKKGYLGRATTEAITLWIRDKEQETIAKQGLDLLEKKHHMGTFGFRSREDIHDRTSRPD